MSLNTNFFRSIVLSVVTSLSLIFSSVSAQELQKNQCLLEKAEFKKLYHKLQESLQYQKAEGKDFEAALFTEYQNAVKKVAKVYQHSKFTKESLNSNSSLVDFFKAIDENSNTEAYLKNASVEKTLNELQKASLSNPNKSFAINENDKYLLRKLLTHAQDRFCRVDSYEKNPLAAPSPSQENLKQLSVSPLNRLIQAIKKGKINSATKVELVDDTTAINSAIAENIHMLSAWLKKNQACREAINSPLFIQSNIQICNYQQLLQTLERENALDIEAALHFINANEKTKKTGLDELKLEAAIDATFNNLGEKTGCSELVSPSGTKRFFVRNFKRDNLLCKKGEITLTSEQCAKKTNLVSDEFGRGMELISRDPSLSFSIEGTHCTDFFLNEAPKEIKRMVNSSPLPEKVVLSVEGNKELLNDLDDIFAYRIDNVKRFHMDFKNLQFYKLDYHPEYLLIRNVDPTLGQFNAFTLMKIAADGKHEKIFDFVSNTIGTKDVFQESTIPEMICAHDPDCSDLNEKKKADEKELIKNIKDWDKLYKDEIEAEINSLVLANIDSKKFATFPESERTEIKNLIKDSILKTPLTSDVRTSIIQQIKNQFEEKYCKKDSATFLQYLISLGKTDQELALQRCSIIRDTLYITEKKFEEVSVKILENKCSLHKEAAVHKEYCENFNTWNNAYSLSTSKTQVQPSEGKLELIGQKK